MARDARGECRVGPAGDARREGHGVLLAMLVGRVAWKCCWRCSSRGRWIGCWKYLSDATEMLLEIVIEWNDR